MTTVGADNFADAPYIELGQSSAYTPNAGYTLETGEPTAWGGKTAWWRFTPTVDAFVYLDVLHSTGSTRAWAYRGFVPAPEFDDLLLVSNPGADTQGGFNVGAGNTYWIRADSDGANVSYVISVGAEVYDEITERRILTAPRVGDNVREDYFVPGRSVSGDHEAWYYGRFDDRVLGGGGITAEMQVGAWASEMVADWPAETGDPSWYNSGAPYDHPIITYGVSSDGTDPISAPDGYDLLSAPFAITIWATAGPDLLGEPDGDVPQVMIDGSFDTLTPLKYLDEFGSPAGDVPITFTPTEFRFDLPASPSASDVEFYYNDGSLRMLFRPNRVGHEEDPFPVGIWYVGQVAIDFTYQSDDPLPYEPPGPPPALTVVELYPREDTYGISSARQLYPEPKADRLYGGRI